MNLSINFHRQIWIFLASLLFFSVMPDFIFVYLCILLYTVIFFIILCVIDFIKRTAYRKKIAGFLEPALLACIVSLIAFYFTAK